MAMSGLLRVVCFHVKWMLHMSQCPTYSIGRLAGWFIQVCRPTHALVLHNLLVVPMTTVQSGSPVPTIGCSSSFEYRSARCWIMPIHWILSCTGVWQWCALQALVMESP